MKDYLELKVALIGIGVFLLLICICQPKIRSTAH